MNTFVVVIVAQMLMVTSKCKVKWIQMLMLTAKVCSWPEICGHLKLIFIVTVTLITGIGWIFFTFVIKFTVSDYVRNAFW